MTFGRVQKRFSVYTSLGLMVSKSRLVYGA